MAELVSYQLHDSIAVVTLDDGKVNVLSWQMLRDIDGALDRAVADGATVVLTGRPGVFSAGLDLRVLRAGGEEAPALLRAGFEAAGTRLTVAAGLAVLTGGLVMLSQIHLATGYAYVAAGLAVTGLGTGATVAAAIDAVMAAANCQAS